MAGVTNNFAPITAGQLTTIQSMQIFPDLYDESIIRFVKTGTYYRGSTPVGKHEYTE